MDDLLNLVLGISVVIMLAFPTIHLIYKQPKLVNSIVADNLVKEKEEKARKKKEEEDEALQRREPNMENITTTSELKPNDGKRPRLKR
jgi:hypothetical protein